MENPKDDGNRAQTIKTRDIKSHNKAKDSKVDISINKNNPNDITLIDSIKKFNPVSDMINDLTISKHKIHIGIKQRTTRSYITSVENLPDDFPLIYILKKMRKAFHCNGSIQEGTGGKFIQLTGDQRMAVKKFLIANELANEENIIVHGY